MSELERFRELKSRIEGLKDRKIKLEAKVEQEKKRKKELEDKIRDLGFDPDDENLNDKLEEEKENIRKELSRLEEAADNIESAMDKVDEALES